jgi:2-C-methyl-D-erythritol 4-phosphate cytidylyltransferase
MTRPAKTSSRLPRYQSIAVVLCAGQGTRMHASQNKVFLPLRGKPMILYSIEALQQAQLVTSILLVAHPSEVALCQSEIVERYGTAGVMAVIPGGATRHQSEERALTYLRSRIEGEESGGANIVLIHDGARPLVTPDEIDQVIQAAHEFGGALLGTRVEPWERIGRLQTNGTIGAILPSSPLWRAQTPQAFQARALLSAYDQAHDSGFEGTDTASSYERLGYPVYMVEGSRDNIKITTRTDLLSAATLLGKRGIPSAG